MAHYLGLDSSTQSLTALIIDTASGEIVLSEALRFGADLPQFGSPNGFLEGPDPSVRQSNPLMWVAAIDLLFSRIRACGYDLGQVKGISGAGQQHGSVYLNARLDGAGWTVESALADQVAPLLSRKVAPIWMDSSTSAECREIASALGGDAEVVRITGSRAIERFTGPQIRAFGKREPESYARTREIHLVSSFVASLLAGRSVPIDYGDGAGMNLLDLSSLEWSSPLLSATAPELGKKLHAPVPSSTLVGSIAPYFVEKYGFATGTPIVAFTGDNPSSLVGMGATRPGTAVISLGTSDTVFAAMSAPRTDPRGFGHVFGNPAGGFMCLICFANGSLAREEVAKRVGLDWPAFERAILNDTAPGNGGQLMLPYFVPEMTPKLLKPEVRLFGDAQFSAFQSPAATARAIVEAQALAMQRYSEFIGEVPSNILATGGAAKNRGILQVIADVFQAEVRTLKVGNSSALGGALRAANAAGKIGWEPLFERFAAPDSASRIAPNREAAAAYAPLRERFALEVDRLAKG
jgi:xylulokinase